MSGKLSSMQCSYFGHGENFMKRAIRLGRKGGSELVEKQGLPRKLLEKFDWRSVTPENSGKNWDPL